MLTRVEAARLRLRLLATDPHPDDLVTDGEVNAAGVEIRQRLEDETDRLTTLPWELLGEERSLRFAEEFEPPCEKLLRRVDITAGVNYQPASRLR